MRLIDADVLKHEIETRHDWYDKNDAEMLTMVDKQPTVDVSSVEPTFYGYPIEHLVKIARVMAKASYTPEEVARMLQNVSIEDLVRCHNCEHWKTLEDRNIAENGQCFGFKCALITPRNGFCFKGIKDHEAY